jgi:hypothetical protein
MVLEVPPGVTALAALHTHAQTPVGRTGRGFALQTAHRAQADALEIEVGAKRRHADEDDAAQERGEVAKPGKPSKGEGLPTANDAGLTYKQIHDARAARDALPASSIVRGQSSAKQFIVGKRKFAHGHCWLGPMAGFD